MNSFQTVETVRTTILKKAHKYIITTKKYHLQFEGGICYYYKLISNIDKSFLNVSCPSRQVSLKYPFSVSHIDRPR